MAKHSPGKDNHPKCDACDFQKLKELENNPVIRSLQDRIEQLSFRLSECKNENQMLKRNLQLAKKMVFQEVGADDVDFQSLMKHGTGEGKKGRQENVILLKKKVQELKAYLKELEGDSLESPETPSEKFVKHQMLNDKKKFWRMELERRLARESAEKDINPLVQECYDLRKGLDTEKNRFKELNEEVKLLRAELQSQVAKNKEDFGIMNSFKTLEKQLQETLAERAEIRQNLEGCRNRNKRLVEEVNALKKELEILHNKTKESNILIDTLTNNHKNIQESINVEKSIVQQNVERYKEDLDVLMKNYAKDVEILDGLQNFMCDRNCLIEELKKDVEEGLLPTEKSKQAPDKLKKRLNDSKAGSPSIVNSKVSKTAQISSSKSGESDPVENVQPDTRSKSNVHKIRLECAKYKALCQAAKMENEYFFELIANQEKIMNDMAVQVIETGKLIMEKNDEKKVLIEKINKLQLFTVPTHFKRKPDTQPKSKQDEIRIKCESQKDENTFLRNFLGSALSNKAEDLELIKVYSADQKKFFQETLKNIEESLKSGASDQTSWNS